MAIYTAATAGVVINRAAVELGLAPQADPYSSQDTSFQQLTYLLNTAGEELALAYDWEFLNASHQITTADTDSGNYPLPSDFLYILNQTGWEETNQVPMFGPLSAQDWTFLKARNLAGHTLYASFRIKDGLFSIFPQDPVPNGLDLNFEYQSRYWVRRDSPLGVIGADDAVASSDLVLFDKVLISRYLKMKFLEAKGLDSTKAQDDFNQRFTFTTGKEKGAEILNAGGRTGFPYLDAYRNVPQSNFGGGT